MELNTYQLLAMRTADVEDKQIKCLTHWALGLAGEAGELANKVKKQVFLKMPVGTGQLADELGDALWYIAVMARELGYDLDDIARGNIDKLLARYPDGFVEGGGNR